VLRAALGLLACALAAACAAQKERAPAEEPTVLMSSDAPPPEARAPEATRRKRGDAEPDPEREVEAALGTMREGPAVDLVRAVGERVAAHSPRREVRYRFFVLDRPEPNAFALPTGQIYVSRGLLALLNTESDLAGVIGHEVAHVAARHVEARERQAVAATVLSALAILAAGVGASDPWSGYLAAPAARAAAISAIASFSREQEREADRLGLDYAVASGYDALGLARALRALDQERRLSEGVSPIPRFFDTHPGGPERFAAAASRGETVHSAADEAGERFLRRLEGLLVGDDPAQGVFRGARFLHAGLDVTLRFPEGWKLANSPSAVVAVAPEGDAAIALEGAGPGPLEARAQSDIVRREVGVAELDRLRVGGAPAIRIVGAAPVGPDAWIPAGEGAEAVDVTWIERGPMIFRVTGRTSQARFRRHTGLFLAAAKSFRRLTDAERAGFRAVRLRLVETHPEESLGALAARTGSEWSAAEIALANGLAKDATLGAPRLLKVARAEPWEPTPAPPAPAEPAGSEASD
jgi:predicted Zn-dependent protease